MGPPVTTLFPGGGLIGSAVTSIILALICASSLLAIGAPLWQRLAGRRPTRGELVAAVPMLGLLPLTLASAIAVEAGVGWGFAVVWLLLVGAGAVLPEGRGAVVSVVRWLPGALRAHPWGLALLPLAVAELLVCWAPNTANDAFTLHYAIIDTFRRTHSLAPQELNTYDYGHLNTELVCTLWMGIAGERMANVFSWVQACSLGATVYLAIRRLAAPVWAACGATMVFTLPVVVHQSAGGWVDTLLVQCALLALLTYEVGQKEPRRLGWGAMAGLFAGYAWGVKQSAPILLLPVALLAAHDLVRHRARRGYVLLFAGVTLLLAAPWLARTWLSTGNPLFPAFPQWTRLTQEVDLSGATGTPKPLPGGLLHALGNHAAARRMAEDSIPGWLVGVCLLGAGLALGAGGGRPHRRWWLCAGVSLLAVWYFFSANPRYAFFCYVFALVPAMASLASAAVRKPPLRWVALTAAALSVALGTIIAGGKAWNRRAVLSGRISPAQFIEMRYPHLALLRRIRHRARPGDALLMFIGWGYRADLPVCDADPRAPGARVANWARARPDEILANCRSLGVRWVLLPLEYWGFRHAIWRWAADGLGNPRPTEAQVRAFVARRFPEWIWAAGPSPGGSDRDPRLEAVRRWDQMRPWLKPVASVPGYALYELRQHPVAVEPAGSGGTPHVAGSSRQLPRQLASPTARPR